MACSGTVQLGCQVFVQDLIDQRGLAGTGNACDTGENTQRNGDINIFQIVFSCSVNGQIISVSGAAFQRQRNFPLTAEILPGNGFLAGKQAFDISGIDNVSAVNACSRTNVHNIVCCKDRIIIMFYNNERIAQVTQPL